MTTRKAPDIPGMVAAMIADDPDAAVIADDLAQALAEMQAGEVARRTAIPLSPIAVTRHKTGLSPHKFATALGITTDTLTSWEQGQRTPKGTAQALLKLLDKHPELIHELP